MRQAPRDPFIEQAVQHGCIEYPCCGRGAVGPAAKIGFEVSHCGRRFRLFEVDGERVLKEVFAG